MVGLENIVFVKQLKLIWKSQKLTVDKIEPQKNKSQLSSTLSSTVCLLHTLFEDLGCAIELHEKIANEVTELHSLDQEIISLMDKKKEMIVLIVFLGKEFSVKHESWCLFAYREFYKNLLAILDEISLRTFGEKTSIQNRF
jgi:hypothetical protein